MRWTKTPWSSGSRDAVADLIAHIRTLQVGAGMLAVMALICGVGWLRAMDGIRVTIPPDLSRGAVVQAGSVHPWDVYVFARYIWQQLNTWHADGGQDAFQTLHAIRPFLSSTFAAQLDSDLTERRARGELRDRTRRLVSDEPYVQAAVTTGDGEWLVRLPLLVTETLRGTEIRRHAQVVTLTVRAMDADPERNPWALVISRATVARSDVSPLDLPR